MSESSHSSSSSSTTVVEGLTSGGGMRIAAGLKNGGKNCWDHCGHRSGMCKWCGTGACCRNGWKGQGGNSGCGKNQGGADYHACVVPNVMNGMMKGSIVIDGVYYRVSEQVQAKFKEMRAMVAKYKSAVESVQAALSKDEKEDSILQEELAKCKAGLSASDRDSLDLEAKLKKTTATLSDKMDELALADKKVVALRSGASMEQGKLAECSAKLAKATGSLATANESL